MEPIERAAGVPTTRRSPNNGAHSRPIARRPEGDGVAPRCAQIRVICAAVADARIPVGHREDRRLATQPGPAHNELTRTGTAGSSHLLAIASGVRQPAAGSQARWPFALVTPGRQSGPADRGPTRRETAKEWQRSHEAAHMSLRIGGDVLLRSRYTEMRSGKAPDQQRFPLDLRVPELRALLAVASRGAASSRYR
jgi:hypothetical protein